MKALHVIAWVLLVIGGLNWLLVGLGGWNVVDMIFGTASVVSRIVYILVGLSALVSIFTHKRDCKACSSASMPSQSM